MTKIKVLIFLANTRAAIAEIRSLIGYKQVEIHIADEKKKFSNYLKFRKYFSKNNYHTYKNKDKLIGFLLNLRTKIGNYEILQNGEPILRFLLDYKELLKKNGITIHLPTTNIYNKFSDKLSFILECQQFKILVPEEIVFPSKFLNPFVIKPKTLKNESDVLDAPMLIENIESYNKLVVLNINIEKHIVQEFISGISYYYCGAYKSGEKIINFTQKNLHQQPDGNSVIRAVPADLPVEIIEKIDLMMSQNNWDGVMMIEMKKSKANGNFYAIECNPRFWGPLQLALDNGVNFPYSVIFSKNIEIFVKQKIGYLWLGGYLHGIFLKFKSNVNFQIFYDNDKNIVFKDVWFRKDSVLYFFAEPFFIISKEFIDFLKRKLFNFKAN